MDMTSPDASGLHLLKFKKMVENAASTTLFALSNAASKASSNFSSEDYNRQHFQFKWMAFSLAPPYGGLLVICAIVILV